MSQDQKDGIDAIVEFDGEVRKSEGWNEIQFGRHDVTGNHEERLQRYQKMPPFGNPVSTDYGIHPQFSTAFYRRQPRCVLDGKPPEPCVACEAGVPTRKIGKGWMADLADLILALEKGDYDGGSLVKGQALEIEELDTSKILDPKNWAAFDNTPIKLQKRIPEAYEVPVYRIYEGPIDQLKAINEFYELKRQLQQGPYGWAVVNSNDGLKNPCAEVALTKPEPVMLMGVDFGCIEYKPEHIKAAKAIQDAAAGRISKPFAPRFNPADYPHVCGCGAPCYNSGFSVQCTAATCRHYKEPK